MAIYKYFLLIIILLFYSCRKKSDPSKPTSISSLNPVDTNYTINTNYAIDTNYTIDEGIFVENVDTASEDENKYNYDNKIFKVGTIFKYSYYLEINNSKYYFEGDNGNWKLVPVNKRDGNPITEVAIEVLNGNNSNKDYNQTVISFKYPPNKSYSISGVRENNKNIWLHPPRDEYFRILHLNPYPFVVFPLAVNKTWKWEMQIGGQWSDTRWKTWDGSIVNKYLYKVTDLVKVKTNLGVLECYEIFATAKSQIGETSLTTYFNEKVGFTKFIYTNIDGSKIFIELQSIKD